MRKKKTRTAKQILEDRADDLARAKVRGRGYCALAGMDKVRCGGILQWAHIVGRSNRRLRWEMLNALCLCAGHHVYYTHHPWEWVKIIEEKFPLEHAFIEMHRNEIWDKDYERVIKELQNGEN